MRKKAMRRILALALAALLGLSGCGAAPDKSAAPSHGAPAPEAGNEPTRDASAPEAASHLTFRTEDKLQQHFEKHGQETGCATAEEYLAAANAVVANPAALHKLQAEDGDDLYFLESTGEFVVVSPRRLPPHLLPNRPRLLREAVTCGTSNAAKCLQEPQRPNSLLPAQLSISK